MVGAGSSLYVYTWVVRVWPDKMNCNTRNEDFSVSQFYFPYVLAPLMILSRNALPVSAAVPLCLGILLISPVKHKAKDCLL